MAALERYSSMNISSPWRGLNVVPNAAIPQGERQAVMFMYSGILASGGGGGGFGVDVVYASPHHAGSANRSVVGVSFLKGRKYAAARS